LPIIGTVWAHANKKKFISEKKRREMSRMNNNNKKVENIHPDIFCPSIVFFLGIERLRINYTIHFVGT
jgi:hypothetical protein